MTDNLRLRKKTLVIFSSSLWTYWRRTIYQLRLDDSFYTVNRGKVEKKDLFDKNLLSMLQNFYIFQKVKISDKDRIISLIIPQVQEQELKNKRFTWTKFIMECSLYVVIITLLPSIFTSWFIIEHLFHCKLLWALLILWNINLTWIGCT